MLSKFDRRLRLYARRTRAEPEDVDEMVRDVWAAAVGRESEFAVANDQWRILQEIARVVCAKWVRTRRHESAARDLTRRYFNAGLDVENEWPDDNSNVWRDVEASFAHLTRRQRQAVRLRFIEGCEYATIATKLQITEITARVHVMVGVRRPRAMLRDE